MFHKTKSVALSLVACLAFTVGCDSDSSGDENSENSANSANSANSSNSQNNVGGLQVLPSKTPRVRFKGGERWANQLSRGLGLERSELCKELDLYDCVDQVHFIALGGVEPYRMRIDEPLPIAPVTAPIAVERISLSACGKRAEQDLANPADAVIFQELGEAPSTDDLNAIGSRLYQRLLSRDALDSELAELTGFWTELEGEETPELQMEWATLTCFAVASSTEMLFY